MIDPPGEIVSGLTAHFTLSARLASRYFARSVYHFLAASSLFVSVYSSINEVVGPAEMSCAVPGGDDLLGTLRVDAIRSNSVLIPADGSTIPFVEAGASLLGLAEFGRLNRLQELVPAQMDVEVRPVEERTVGESSASETRSVFCR
jgi:hypothetical protein